MDAPGITGGRFAILPSGNVGINNNSPAAKLDVGGNINASGSITGGSVSTGGNISAGSLTVAGGGVINGGIATSAGITTGAGVSVGGPLTINGDKPMTAAPHMFFTGNLPGPLFAGQPAAFVIPDKNILITRFSMYVNVPFLCSPAGTVSIVNNLTSKDLRDLTITNPFNDSGPISIPIAAGTQVSVYVTTAPVCGIFPATRNGAVSIEYVMQ